MNPKYTLMPAPGYLVVEPVASDFFNKTELATLEDEKERISTGKVVSVSKYGGTYENFGFQVSTDAKVGDFIAYQAYTEHPISLNGRELYLVRFDKVTGIIRETK